MKSYRLFVSWLFGFDVSVPYCCKGNRFFVRTDRPVCGCPCVCSGLPSVPPPGTGAPGSFRAGPSVSQLLHPCPDGFLVGPVEQFPVFPFQIGVGLSQCGLAVADTAPARCGERNHAPAFQVVAFDECVDDPRSEVPPDRIPDEHRVVSGHTPLHGFECRPCLRIVHLRRTARTFVVPVEIGIRIGLCGSDRKELASRRTGQFFRSGCRRSGRREVSHQYAPVSGIAGRALLRRRPRTDPGKDHKSD